MVFVSSTTQQLVVPPAGAAMCEIPTGAEITGFLTPPSGATTLSLELALIDESPIQQLQQAHSGVYVDITTLSGSVTVADGGSVAPPADTTALWTGFQPLTVTLPADASGGFWLTIRTSDYEPPIHTPEVLVDGIHF
jgi:hypothetical protein